MRMSDTGGARQATQRRLQVRQILPAFATTHGSICSTSAALVTTHGTRSSPNAVHPTKKGTRDAPNAAPATKKQSAINTAE